MPRKGQLAETCKKGHPLSGPGADVLVTTFQGRVRRVCRPCNRERQRGFKRMKRYGLTEDDFVRMLEEQEGACAICHEVPEKPEDLCIDHDHDTGVVRGLLCRPCNTGLGGFRDRPELFEAAIQYVSGR